MTDYFSAIKNSLEAASVAQRQNDEIMASITDLNNQVLNASKESATVLLQKFRREPSTTVSGMISKMAQSKEYIALTLASTFNPAKFHEIALWHQENIGYPIDIIAESSRFSCRDKISLEKVLLSIVSSVKFGTQLKSIIEYNILAIEMDKERKKTKEKK